MMPFLTFRRGARGKAPGMLRVGYGRERSRAWPRALGTGDVTSAQPLRRSAADGIRTSSNGPRIDEACLFDLDLPAGVLELLLDIFGFLLRHTLFHVLPRTT